jgi:threonine/homoserine/homoserine lactone efflux protein
VIIVIPARILEYIVAGLAIILAPGPSVLFTIARAIAFGRATAVATVLGNSLGMFTVSILVALGLGPIFQHHHLIYVTMQWFGALYLIYLGIDAITHSKAHADAMTDLKEERPSFWRAVRQGYTVGVLNPKGIIFFAAILPEFADSSKGHLTAQLVLMGFIFVFLGFFCDGTWGMLAGTLRKWLAAKAERLVLLRKIGGVVMIALGIITFANSILH